MSTQQEYSNYIVSPKNSFQSISLNEDELNDDIYKPKGYWIQDNLGAYHQTNRSNPRSIQRNNYNDDPKYWNMYFIAKTRGYNFCSGGYSRQKYNTSQNVSYWWCRLGDWLPNWGDLTIQKKELMTNMRNYWLNKWFSDEVPKIKEILLDSTPLIEDVVNKIEKYLIYPYQIKRF